MEPILGYFSTQTAKTRPVREKAFMTCRFGQLATTLDDNPALQNITARVLITDSLKVNPLSDTIEANMGLGEIKSATS